MRQFGAQIYTHPPHVLVRTYEHMQSVYQREQIILSVIMLLVPVLTCLCVWCVCSAAASVLDGTDSEPDV